MTHEFHTPTIIEDPCCGRPVAGPTAMVRAVRQADGLVVEFYLPAVGYVWDEPMMLVHRVPVGQSPDPVAIARLVRYCLAEDDLADLLRAIATKFGFPDSWAPPAGNLRKERAAEAFAMN